MVNKNIDKYPFEIRKLSDEEGGGYMISSPDFNSCISDGFLIPNLVQTRIRSYQLTDFAKTNASKLL